MASDSERQRVARPYRRDGDAPQPVKEAVNAWIAAAAAGARLPSAGEGPIWALVLESRNLLTVKALRAVDCGVTDATTVVPNPDPEELAAIAAAAPELVALPLSSHGLFAALAAPSSPERELLLQRGWSGRLGVVWLDFCGTFGGSARAGRQRQHDLEQLFSQKLLLPAAVLAVTFTTRGASELYRGELLESLVLLAEGYALRYGQRARLSGAASYCSHSRGGTPTVFTALFVVGDGSSEPSFSPPPPTTMAGPECALECVPALPEEPRASVALTS